MRLVSFLVLLALAGGIGYVLVYKRDWLFKQAEEGLNIVQGYKPARTPSEAMDQFTRAINDRNYKAAALYCTGEYAEHLRKAHDAGRAVGADVDKISNLMKDKGLHTDKSEALLFRLDPFPQKFRVGDVKKKDETHAVGVWKMDAGTAVLGTNVEPELNKMDRRILSSVLLPPSFYQAQVVPIVAEGTGDDRQWKLDIPLPPGQRDAIDHFVNTYRSYVTALNAVLNDLRNGRYANKHEFERDFINQLAGAR